MVMTPGRRMVESSVKNMGIRPGKRSRAKPYAAIALVNTPTKSGAMM